MSTESTVPAWLDQQELQEILKQNVLGFSEIISISCKNNEFHTGVQPDLRLQIEAKVDYTTTTQHLCYSVKSADQAKTASLKFPRPSNFEVEFEMYDEVLPALMKLYKDVGRNIEFSPRRLKLKELKNSNCIYLQCVYDRSYWTLDQWRDPSNELNRRGMKAALSLLAAYHAATVLYLQEKPSRIDKLTKLLSSHQLVGESEELKSILQLKFRESLRANELSQYEDKVKSFQRHIVEATGAQDINNSSFNVILNGACWPNNLLFAAFSHEKDILFVDFHAAKYGPAVYDVFNLLLSAPCAEDKVTKFDANLKYYHEQLIENLQLLNFKGALPKFKDLQIDLLKYGHWGFKVATEILPIIPSDLYLEDLDVVFKNPKYAEQIKEILPWLEIRGYFAEK